MLTSRTPHRLPTFRAIVEDLEARPAEVAQALGVGISTVYRWWQKNNAPRPAMLALFWLSRWGQSAIDCDMHNRAEVFEGLAHALERELWRQREDFATLARIGHYGSANDPLQHIAPLLGLDDARTLEARRPGQPRSDNQDGPPVRVHDAKR